MKLATFFLQIFRSLTDTTDHPVIHQAVTSSSAHRNRGSIHTISGSSPFNIPEEELITNWAQVTDQLLTYAFYALFFTLHLINLIFGTAIMLPLFFDLNLHLGKIIDDEGVCYPPLFWFNFLTLGIEYFLISLFVLSFAKIVPAETSEFLQELES